MPFSSNANNFFSRVPNEREALTDSGLPLQAALATNAIKSPNLFQAIQAARNNELDRKVKQAQISKFLSEINNPLENEYKQAQIQALKDKSEYQNALVDAKLANNDRLLQQQTLLSSLLGGSGSNLPPGSTANIGGLRVPLNQRLTDSEQAAVSGSQSIEPVVKDIVSSINSGIFGKGDVERTLRQSIIDSGKTLLSSKDVKLQSFQQDLANLKRLIPFTDGGKQLTPFEAERVFALLNTTGKNDQQAVKDINAAVSIVLRKGSLSIGGRNEAIRGMQQEATEDNDPLGVL